MHDQSALTLLERLLKAAALLGGVTLFAIMLLVSYSVFCRYVLNQPILGDQELVEISMALVVMLAMPYAAWRGEHIRVDILDAHLGAAGRFCGDVFARSVGAVALGLLVHKATNKMFDAYEYGDVTNMIEIPVWIAYAAVAFGMGLFAFVLIWQLIWQLIRGVSSYD